MTFLIMLHYTYTGPFSGCIACIGVLDYGPKKNIQLLFSMPLVLINRIHPNIPLLVYSVTASGCVDM